ncbi:MAG TPA: SMP-30/gluconolactonase/LRE family protein [Chroococcidiopsis sp.]
MMTKLKTRWQRLCKRWQQRWARPYLRSHHPQFDRLFPRGTKIERIATGFQFTEGPVWRPVDHTLLFSDIPANCIYQLDANQTVTVFRSPSGHSNGLTCDRHGRLIACEHGPRRVTRTELDGTITVLADSFDGKPLNSPNDVVVAADGAIYFTDPPYGISPQQQQQPAQGVYRIAPDGQIRQVVGDFDRPNGLAFSPDGRQLYIDDSARRHVRVFEVQADGSLTGDRLFADLAVPQPGVPDGMKLDQAGNLFCTGPGGIWVFDPTGLHLGTIGLPEQPANCAWGDRDYCTLYITACTSLYRIRCSQPGWVP